jgi:aspartyl-tRNA(Asn)/glutamyl-tRNA(Gln) amidotransferase subunit C
MLICDAIVKYFTGCRPFLYYMSLKVKYSMAQLMMLSESDMQKLFQLAHLSLTPEERPSFTEKFNKVLKMIESLAALSTEGVEPFTHGQDHRLRDRPDTITESNERAILLRSAAKTHEGLYLVPSVINEDLS